MDLEGQSVGYVERVLSSRLDRGGKWERWYSRQALQIAEAAQPSLSVVNLWSVWWYPLLRDSVKSLTRKH